MSLKPVELQIALPRTTEAGKLQNESQQRPAIDQHQLAGQNVKQSQELPCGALKWMSLLNQLYGMAVEKAILIQVEILLQINTRTRLQPVMPSILTKVTH